MPRTCLTCALILVFLAACTPSTAADVPSSPGFFYQEVGTHPMLVIQDSMTSSKPRLSILFGPPPDCSFWAMAPAPIGRWIIVEWECTSGPSVEAYDTASGGSHPLINDTTVDSHFLAWNPDGRHAYLKIGTLSYPQIVQVDVENGQAISLPISAFVYDIALSPDRTHMLYSLNKGLGFGSETWTANPEGKGASQLIVDAQNILGLMHYSPDGKQVAYIRLPDTQASFPPGQLWIMNADGSNAHDVADADAGHGMPPVWSPDGRSIAFVGRDNINDPNSTNLSILDVASGKISSYPFQLLLPPVWSPDGHDVLFTISKNDTMQIWFHELSSGREGLLVDAACCSGWLAGSR